MRRNLGIPVQMVRAGYGEFRVLVDDEVVIDAGALAALGVLPSRRRVLAAVRQRVAAGS